MNDDTITALTADHAPVPPPAFLTVPEAAEVAGLAQRTIRRALREGRLAGAHVGGRWTVDPADLPRFQRIARRRGAAQSGTVPPPGTGTKAGAQSVTAPEPVANGAALVLAAEVAGLVSTVGVLTARLEAAEGEIAALRDALADAQQPRRSWWARMFGGAGAPAAAEGVPDGSPAVVLDITQAREKQQRDAA
ncbi:MAG: helix-turn-helix domain-containing protein [Miltoncostaeaceae bacterium]